MRCAQRVNPGAARNIIGGVAHWHRRISTINIKVTAASEKYQKRTELHFGQFDALSWAQASLKLMEDIVINQEGR